LRGGAEGDTRRPLVADTTSTNTDSIVIPPVDDTYYTVCEMPSAHLPDLTNRKWLGPTVFPHVVLHVALSAPQKNEGRMTQPVNFGGAHDSDLPPPALKRLETRPSYAVRRRCDYRVFFQNADRSPFGLCRGEHSLVGQCDQPSRI
jgi:hypothetical protein